jgi:hypothetical protein
VETVEVSKVTAEEWLSVYYEDDERAQFRHEAWAEECGFDPNEHA